ncbi:MAG: GNAT family N-acetyltransferase [Erythrobacter sp.]
MENPIIKTAELRDADSILDAMTLSFSVDPISRWMWPEPGTYLKAFPRLAKAFGFRGLEEGTAYMVEGPRAAAMWLKPGTEVDGDAIGALVEETIPEERLEEVGAFFGQVQEFHPQIEHWYLPMIGADPAYIGQGLGAALMKHALSVCDDQSLPAYLESSNPRNISLYERHGFEVMGTIQTETSPVMTPMYRAAR